MNCENCAKRINQKAINTAYAGIIGVYQCPHCQAVMGQCYKGESYKIVLPYFAPIDAKLENQRYFDLTVLGGNGVERRHGWFDIESKRIVQVG